MNENFNFLKGYYDSLAANLKEIRKTGTEEAQDVLEEEKQIDVAAEITLTIDYTKTPEQVIADGNYALEDYFNIASKNFPISPEMIGKKVEVATKLFHFNRDISSSDEVIAEMDKDGYRPATLTELLALGFLLPALQRQFKIAALGSVWHEDSGSYVPCLYVVDSRSELSRNGFDRVLPWTASSRFLGVRK